MKSVYLCDTTRGCPLKPLGNEMPEELAEIVALSTDPLSRSRSPGANGSTGVNLVLPDWHRNIGQIEYWSETSTLMRGVSWPSAWRISCAIHAPTGHSLRNKPLSWTLSGSSAQTASSVATPPAASPAAAAWPTRRNATAVLLVEPCG